MHCKPIIAVRAVFKVVDECRKGKGDELYKRLSLSASAALEEFVKDDTSSINGGCELQPSPQ